MLAIKLVRNTRSSAFHNFVLGVFLEKIVVQTVDELEMVRKEMDVHRQGFITWDDWMDWWRGKSFADLSHTPACSTGLLTMIIALQAIAMATSFCW